MSAGSAEAIEIAQSTAIEAKAAFADGWSDPSRRADTLDALSQVAATASDRLDTVDIGPDNALIGPVGSRHHDAALELASAQQTLADAEIALAGAADFVRGPNTYLFFAANNAEMRAGSGMFLQVGELRVTDGNFDLSGMRSVQEMAKAPRGSVEVDPEVSAMWSYLDSTQEWRNLATTPRFDVTARQAAAMWKASGGADIDGVIVADVKLLEVLTKATGPIAGPQAKLSASKVIPWLLRDQYLSESDDDVRRDDLGRLATSAVEGLDGDNVEVAALASGFARAAAGRHLLMWSDNEGQQAAWDAAGVAGLVESDSAMVSIVNRGGNKLDPYLEVGTDLKVDQGPSATTGRLVIELRNAAPEGDPQIISGPYAGSGFAEGEYRGLLTINLPKYASNVELVGDSAISFSGSDGATNQYVIEVAVPRGVERTIEIAFDLPDRGSLTILSSARVPAVDWSLDSPTESRKWTDDEPFTFEW